MTVGALCPHQDYVYFNYPTREEMQIVSDFRDKSSETLVSLMEDQSLCEVIRGHKVFTGEKSGEEMLEEPAYLSALLIYMKNQGLKVSPSLQRLLGVKDLPVMSEKWMEILLQKLLYDAKDDFFCEGSYRDTLISELKRKRLIEKRKVIFATSTAIEKMLLSSKGMIESILAITEQEYQTMGQDLRMLILTDYIRKEYEKNLGALEEEVHQLGVLPFFEMIRRHFEVPFNATSKEPTCLRLGVLCGSIVIIPAEAKHSFIHGINESLLFGKTHV